MTDGQVHVLIALCSGIFSAGGFYVYVRLSLTRLREDAALTHQQIRCDINAIGRKVAESEKRADRRHHNVSMVLMLAAPVRKESEVCNLLKEG